MCWVGRGKGNIFHRNLRSPLFGFPRTKGKGFSLIESTNKEQKRIYDQQRRGGGGRCRQLGFCSTTSIQCLGIFWIFCSQKNIFTFWFMLQFIFKTKVVKYVNKDTWQAAQSLVFTNCRHACSAERLQAWAVLLLDSFAQSSSLVEWRKGVEYCSGGVGWGWACLFCLSWSWSVFQSNNLFCFCESPRKCDCPARWRGGS